MRVSRTLSPASAELLHAVACHHDRQAARPAEAAVLYHANQLDAQAATREHHHRVFDAEALGEVIGVAREAEARHADGLLADGPGDERVGDALLDEVERAVDARHR